MLGEAANIDSPSRTTRFHLQSFLGSVGYTLKRFCEAMTPALTDHEDGVISVTLFLKRPL